MTAAPSLTLQQFLALEDTKPALEYAGGEVTQKPMPNWSHATIQLYLGSLLLRFLAGTQLGRVVTEFRCIFGPPGRPRAFVPDLAVISRAKLPVDEYLYGAPDLAIEILSPGQSLPRFVARIQFYLRFGVRLVWVVDPTAQTVTVFTPDEEERTLSAGDILDGGTVVPGFSVPVDDIFAQTAP